METLSKGYRQRVGLAQAILHKPDVRVLDWMEVTGGQSVAGGYTVGADEGQRSYVQALGSGLIALACISCIDA